MVRGKRGQVLVLVALAIFVLLGFAALGIDVGFMYSVRHELQRSADAGALAGASAFTTGDWNDTSMSSTSPRGIADARAREFASKDKVIQTTLNPASEVAVSFPRHDHIEVVTSRIADLFFARIFGISNRFITARAVAKAEVAGPQVPTNCIKPWAIPVPWNDNTGVDNRGNPTTVPDGLYESPEEVYTTLNADGTWTPRCVDPSVPTGMCPGTQMTLKIGSPSSDNTSPSGQQSSGQFFIIQGNLGGETFQGSQQMEFFIREGCFPIDLSKPADLMPGNRMGPTVDAVEDLINDPTYGDPGQTWNALDKHPNPTTKYPNWEASPRVVRVVLYNPSVPMMGNTGGTGTGTYIPVGYQLAGFWLESVGRQGNDGWVTGRYIPGSAFGSGSPPPGPVTGTEVKVISLVE